MSLRKHLAILLAVIGYIFPIIGLCLVALVQFGNQEEEVERIEIWWFLLYLGIVKDIYLILVLTS